MAGFSPTYRESILNHFFMKTAFSQLTNIYIALSTTDPGDDGSTITEVATPATSGYDRAQTAGSDWTVSTASTVTTCSNATAQSFGAATANLGNVSHFALYDSASGGAFIGSGALGTPRTFNNGDTLNFAIGELDFTLTAT